jgi:hypothetical protein
LGTSPIARQPIDQNQRGHDLREDGSHSEERSVRQVLLRSRDGDRQKREIQDVPDDDKRQQCCASSIDEPAQHTVRNFKNEGRHRCAVVQAETEPDRRSRPERDIARVCHEIQDQVGRDPDADCTPERSTAKSSFQDQPRERRGTECGAD